MLKPTDIRVGNLIQYDHDERRQPPVCMQRGWVKEIHTDYVVLTNGEKRKWERTEGLPIDEALLVKFGFVKKLASNGHDIYTHPELWDLEFIFTENGFRIDWKSSIEYGRCKFIHQLQNQHYWLITDELEITVPESRPQNL